MKISHLLFALVAPFAVAEDGVNGAPLETSENEAHDPAPGEVQAPAATVAIDVPVEHADLITRAVALLARGEQWVADNIHAGISHFEGIFGMDAEAKPAEDEAEMPADEQPKQ